MSYLTLTHESFRLFFVLCCPLILSACGGGGSNSSTTHATGAAAVFVNIGVETRVARSGTGVEYYALVEVRDKSYNGTPISTAAVEVNGTLLTLQGALFYAGYVPVDTAGKLNLKVVTTAGDEVQASVSAITAIPALNGPAVFDNAIDNFVTWNRPTGMPTSIVMPEYVMYMQSSISNRRYATISGTTGKFSTGCCAPSGAYDLILEARSASPITTAAPSSSFWVTTKITVSVNVI